MAYIDKCFNFDLDDREIPLAHPYGYAVSYWDTATVRKRQPELGGDESLISIELWQTTRNSKGEEINPLYGEYVADDEVCLTKEDALKLAQKLIRAVNELGNQELIKDYVGVEVPHTNEGLTPEMQKEFLEHIKGWDEDNLTKNTLRLKKELESED